MGRQSSDLQQRYDYQRQVLSWMMAQALRRSCERRPVGVLRYEYREPKGVDDIVLQLPDAQHAWQVKTNASTLELQVVLEVLEACVPADSHGHLALTCHLKVTAGLSTGSLGRLADLSRLPNARAADVRKDAYQEEGRWLSLLEEHLPHADPMDLVKRLHLHTLDKVADLDTSIRTELGHHFSADEVDRIRERLDFLAARTTHGSQAIDEDALWDAVSPVVAPTSSPRGRRLEARRQYLEGFLLFHGTVPPLHGLETRGLDIPLSTIRAPRTVHSVEPGPLQTERPLFDLLRADSEGYSFLLTAPAGQGKTELLREAALACARRALSDPDAPIPAWYPAWRFDQSQPAEPSVPVDVSDFPCVVFIDGLDEVEGARRRETMRSNVHRLHAMSATRRLVMSSRNEEHLGLPLLRVLSLSPWTESSTSAVLERLSQADPERVERWRTHRDLRALWQTPLLLTLSLQVPARPHSTTRSVFEDVCRDQFMAWTDQRTAVDADVLPERWDQVKGPLGRLALAALARGSLQVDASELREAFRLLGSGARRGQRWSTLFGLLATESQDRARFTHRALAEFLAGEELAGRSAEEILETIEAVPTEVFRHAVARLSHHEPALLLQVVDRMLAPCETDFVGHVLVRPAHLRRLLVLVEVSPDCIGVLNQRAEPIARLLLRYLTEETSSWVGSRVAETMAFLPTDSQVWSTSLALVCEATTPPFDESLFGCWEAGSGSDDLWLARLLHRLPSARLAALERHTFDDRILLSMVWDETREPHSAPPALAAGRILRSSPRTVAFEREILPHLRDSLGSRQTHQTLAVACAAALRPDEVDLQQWIRAVKPLTGNSLVDLSQELTALSSTPEGAAALDAHWPTWRQEVGRTFPRTGEFAAQALPSPIVLERCASVLRIAPDERAWACLDRLASTGTAVAMEAVLRHPHLAASMLERLGTEARFHRFPYEAQVRLGELLPDHPSLRSAFDDLWETMEPSFRPGHAYEAQLAADPDDLALAERLGRWLAARPYGIIVPHLGRPRASTLEHPVVASILTDDALETIAAVRTPDARGVRLAPSTLVEKLVDWAPAWASEPVRSALEDLLDDPSNIEVAVALGTIWHPADQAGLEHIRQALAFAIEALDPEYLHFGQTLPRTVTQLARRPIGAHLIDTWRRAACIPHVPSLSLAATIAIAACSTDPEESRRAAERAAARRGALVKVTLAPHLPLAHPAAPDAFVERALTSMRQGDWHALETMEALLPYLEPERARQLLDEITTSLASAYGLLIRQRRPYPSFDVTRPVDEMDRLRFSGGLPLPAMEASSSEAPDGLV